MEPRAGTNSLKRHRRLMFALGSLACAIVAAGLLIHLYRSYTVSSHVASWIALRLDDEFATNWKRSNESKGSWWLFVRQRDGVFEILPASHPTLSTSGYDSILWVVDRQYNTSLMFPTRARSFVSYHPKADDPWVDRMAIPHAIREQAAALFKQEYGTRAESVFRLLVDEDQPRESVRWSGCVANGVLAGSVLGVPMFALLAIKCRRSTRCFDDSQRVAHRDLEGTRE